MHRAHPEIQTRRHTRVAVAIATLITAVAIAAASLSLAADSTGADPPAASTARLVVPLQLRWWVPPGLEPIDRLLATGHFYPSMGWL